MKFEQFKRNWRRIFHVKRYVNRDQICFKKAKNLLKFSAKSVKRDLVFPEKITLTFREKITLTFREKIPLTFRRDLDYDYLQP